MYAAEGVDKVNRGCLPELTSIPPAAEEELPLTEEGVSHGCWFWVYESSCATAQYGRRRDKAQTAEGDKKGKWKKHVGCKLTCFAHHSRVARQVCWREGGGIDTTTAYACPAALLYTFAHAAQDALGGISERVGGIKENK